MKLAFATFYQRKRNFDRFNENYGGAHEQIYVLDKTKKQNRSSISVESIRNPKY